MTQFRFTILIIMLVTLSACASNVVVTGDIPKPLMSQLPLSAKLNLSDKFLGYTYTEQDKGRAINTLSFGEAQKELFQRVFGSAFILNEDPLAITDVEINPKVLSIQYSAPRETSLNIYEVFVKYRITLTGANQKELADWVIKGYGKTPTAYLSGADAAFNAATNVALRDVGAQISIGLPLQSSIKELLNSKSESRSTTNRESASKLDTKPGMNPTVTLSENSEAEFANDEVE